MIEQLETLSNSTVWEFFRAQAHNPEVYTNTIEGFVPFLEGFKVWLFARKYEVVFLCTDQTQPHTDELADEAPYFNKEPLYFTADSRRVSPVYYLSRALSYFSRSLECVGIRPPLIRGVLLSNSHFINYDYMVERWQDMGIVVFHDMHDTIRHDISFDVHKELPMDRWFQLFKDYCIYMEEIKVVEQAQQEQEEKKEEEKEEKEKQPDEDNDANTTDLEDETDNDNETDNDGEAQTTDSFMMSSNSTVKVEILRPIGKPKEELDRLVGCCDIKKHIEQLIALNRYNHLMRHVTTNGKSHHLALHGLFFGSPGTGKTTVCKIFGSLLHKAGMLSKGHVCVCSRSTFLGRNWGDEECAVREVVEMARGGVLMIDEAYQLNSNHSSDPGKLVIPLLMDILANDKQRDIAIILCGYKDEMLRLLDLNPGLESRFPNRFEFPEFTIDDLLEITRRRIHDYGYHFTRTAWVKYKHLLTDAYNSRDPMTWGNARYVSNLLEHIYLRHAVRCIKLNDPDESHLLSITPADIEPIEIAKAKPKIGF